MKRAGGHPAPVGEVHWLEQVHGTAVVLVGADAPVGRPPDGPGRTMTATFAGQGDALVSATPSACLAVLTADCAPVALGSGEGVFAAVHAGWRGLMEGILEEAVGAMRAMGATDVVGALGPCIHPGCYEFGEDDLARVVGRYGSGVRGGTAAGRPGLDLPATVSAALAASGAREIPGMGACTACSPGYFSHRARGDAGRQA
ncbi:MAG TPA: polyphenol oxidase family protein, partial [Acidimicrobiales bacterium]